MQGAKVYSLCFCPCSDSGRVDWFHPQIDDQLREPSSFLVFMGFMVTCTRVVGGLVLLCPGCGLRFLWLEYWSFAWLSCLWGFVVVWLLVSRELVVLVVLFGLMPLFL